MIRCKKEVEDGLCSEAAYCEAIWIAAVGIWLGGFQDDIDRPLLRPKQKDGRAGRFDAWTGEVRVNERGDDYVYADAGVGSMNQTRRAVKSRAWPKEDVTWGE